MAAAFLRLSGDALIDQHSTLLLEASWVTHSNAGDGFGVVCYGTESGAEIKVENYNWQDTLRIYTDVAELPAEIRPQLTRAKATSRWCASSPPRSSVATGRPITATMDCTGHVSLTPVRFGRAQAGSYPGRRWHDCRVAKLERDYDTMASQKSQRETNSSTVWNEYRHELQDQQVADIYPQGIHNTIAGFLREAGLAVRTATLDEPENGLPPDVLNNTDVLIWWGHLAHREVNEEVVDRVQARVLDGMGLIALRSAHLSKVFRRLMGTSCDLTWRGIASWSGSRSLHRAIPLPRGWQILRDRTRRDLWRAIRCPPAGNAGLRSLV